MSKPYYDLNYEEISCERDLANGAWANGLQNFRFSIAPSSGGAFIPSMSYFLVEYNFGSATNKTNEFTATKALEQKQKIALQNNFMGCMYSAATFKMAGTDISVINNSHAQASVLQHRLGLTTEFIENIGPDLNGYDPDFSRRLAKVCSDGVYHRDGLIDCSPYASDPLGYQSIGSVVPLAMDENQLKKDASGKFYIGTTQGANCKKPTTGNYATIFGNLDGSGDITHDTKEDDTRIHSFVYILPTNSFLEPITKKDEVINGTLLQVGDILTFHTGSEVMNGLEFRILNTSIVSGTATKLMMQSYTGKLVVEEWLKAFDSSAAGPYAGTGISSVRRKGTNIYTQADPRSNIVNNMVMYQPPLAFFQCDDPGVFFGDMQIQLTPNSNWRTAAIEASDGEYYNNELKHGTDFCFGIKSMRLYLARVKIPSLPSKNPQFSMPDMLIANKSLPNGSSNIDFIVPPSTQKVVIWIQDTSAGSNPKLPMTRFKTRQYTGTDGLNVLNQYGPWAHTLDERLQSIQCTFAGITKPMSNFQRGGIGDGGSPSVNQMLQRWMMTNQNNDNRQEPEKFHDWLSMGPYYLFDFSRDSSNLGTYLQVKVNYDGKLPTDGVGAASTGQSTVNLYVCAIYDRDIALTYGQFGNVIAAQTQMS